MLGVFLVTFPRVILKLHKQLLSDHTTMSLPEYRGRKPVQTFCRKHPEYLLLVGCNLCRELSCNLCLVINPNYCFKCECLSPRLIVNKTKKDGWSVSCKRQGSILLRPACSTRTSTGFCRLAENNSFQRANYQFLNPMFTALKSNNWQQTHGTCYY